jgi:hypothetical protein
MYVSADERKKEGKKNIPRIRLSTELRGVSQYCRLTAARQSPHCVSLAPDLTTSRLSSSILRWESTLLYTIRWLHFVS